MAQTTVYSRVFGNGDIRLQTNNEKLENHLGFLYQIITGKTTCKYVSLKTYGSKFGNPAYTFKFWGASSLDKALERESLETKIERTYEDLILSHSEDESETLLKDLFNNQENDLIEEMLPLLKEKYKKPVRVELDFSDFYKEIEEEAA